FANRRLIINNKYLGFALPVFSDAVSILGMLDVLTVFQVYGKNSRFRRPGSHKQCAVQKPLRRCYLCHQGFTDRFYPPGLTRAPSESGPLTSLSGNRDSSQKVRALWCWELSVATKGAHTRIPEVRGIRVCAPESRHFNCGGM